MNKEGINVQRSHPAVGWAPREAWLLALVCLLVGLIAGYLLRGTSSPAVAAAASFTAGGPGSDKMPLHDATAVRVLAEPLLAVVKAEPRNVEALVKVGNLYYDNHVYVEAAEYYTRALELRPQDFNVRTDLGTAYWYSGNPVQAITEYEKALKAKPGYAPTLLNLGIVRMEGLGDNAAAIAAWEELLKKNPEYTERRRVEELIARARSRGPQPATGLRGMGWRSRGENKR